MAVEYAERRAWLDRDVHPSDWRTAFFILVWINDPFDRNHPPVAVYGHGANQLGRSVNGVPMFTKLTLIYPTDWEIFSGTVNRLNAARAEALR